MRAFGAELVPVPSENDKITPTLLPSMIPKVRPIAQEEGIFSGTSTGLNLVGALQLAKELGKGHTVLTVAVDSGLKYLWGSLYKSLWEQIGS